MIILIGELVIGFVFGIGATLAIMFACDRYDDKRENEEEAKRADIMKKRKELADAYTKRDQLSHDDQMELIREFSDSDREDDA